MTKKYWECDHYKSTGVTDESGKYWDGPGLCDLNDKFCLMEGDMPCEIFEEEKAERIIEEEGEERDPDDYAQVQVEDYDAEGRHSR